MRKLQEEEQRRQRDLEQERQRAEDLKREREAEEQRLEDVRRQREQEEEAERVRVEQRRAEEVQRARAEEEAKRKAAQAKAAEKKRKEEADRKKALGVKHWIGDLSWERSLERLASQPTVNIEGLVAGYTGPGGKTVLPARAVAKLDLRLVPDMTVEDSLANLKAARATGFRTVLVTRHRSRAARGSNAYVDLRLSSVQQLVRTLRGMR
ncbi:MAG: peptidase dimerization domain-containing protein [Rhizobiales bacterium]|nr:peptidase dimerization domain-containing protein [Hyphomicrobiales bacterium]